MKCETRFYTPPSPIPTPFSFVNGPAFTYLWIISHQFNVSESNFKENICIQNILINQKASKLVNSLLLSCAINVKVWDNMASLYNDGIDFISSDLIGQIFLNDWHVGTLKLPKTPSKSVHAKKQNNQVIF